MNNNSWFKKEKPLLSLQSMSGGAAGTLMQGASEKVYIDEVFSNYVYPGDSSSNRTITNSIDLSDKGGLVWTKARDNGLDWHLFNTDSGLNKYQVVNSSAAEATIGGGDSNYNNTLKSFNTDGFTLGSSNIINGSNDYLSWTFRKQAKFFDMVTWTGTGSAHSISHSLGSTPGCIIIKNLSQADNWIVYHRSLGATHHVRLNQSNASASSSTMFNDTEPTASVFTVGTNSSVNTNSDNYIAYLFAHHNSDGSFGESSNSDVISCNTYTGNGSDNGPTVTLGWEPQWILIKRTSGTENWCVFDSMRGVTTNGVDARIELDAGTDNYGFDFLDFTSTGFKLTKNVDSMNGSGDTYVYVAIRRTDGYVGKPAEAGTDVFAMDTGSGSSTVPNFDSTFPVDFAFARYAPNSANWDTSARLMQARMVRLNLSDAGLSATSQYFDSMGGWNKYAGWDSAAQSWMWKRGQGMDVVAWTGTDVARTINHSMNAVPEMMWIKNRSQSNDWMVYHKGLNGGTNPEQYYVVLNGSAAEVDLNTVWNDTAPTSSVFSLGSHSHVNGNADNFIGMLFSSVEGISKCGSYSPSSTSTTVTCGFQPRFVVVKAATKDNIWSVADSLRGINAGNDPCLVLNEDWESDKYGSADWIDVSATGFTVNSAGGAGTADANSNGETYIYYAHA